MKDNVVVGGILMVMVVHTILGVITWNEASISSLHFAVMFILWVQLMQYRTDE